MSDPGDDPASPSGVFPQPDGTIMFVVHGDAAGTVVPVVHLNGGSSTALELDADGVPTEAYGLGGSAVYD